MPITFTKTQARFQNTCTVEEALPLLEFLNKAKAPKVDLAACTYLHTALLQLLLMARPRISAPPSDPVVARWVGPLLTRHHGGD